MTVSAGNASPSGAHASDQLGVNAASSAPTKVVTAATTLTPTTITITTSNSTPAVNQPFTLSGTLKSGTTPLSGKRICLGRTDSSGNYSVVNTPANAPVSVAVGTLTPTTITITTSNSTPAVNQPFTLSGTLKSGTTPLSGKRICLGRTDSSGNYSVVNTTTTNANGAYTFTRSESAQGRYSFLAVFYGDTYAPANAPVSVAVGTLTPTTITITTSNSTPAVNQPFTLSGTLKSGTTPPLANASVSAERIRQATTAWSTPPPPTPTVPTPSPAANPRRAATPSWQSSTAIPTPPLTLRSASPSAICKKPSLVSSQQIPRLALTSPTLCTRFLQNGVTGAPLAGQPINMTIRSPTGKNVAHATTTASNGSYTFTRSESAPGTYEYGLNFGGNSSYFPQASMLFLTVGNPIPTELSLNITNSTPAVNQSFTISGYLTDINGTKLRTGHFDMNTRLPTGSWTSTETATNSNGYYSVTYSEQTAGQYRYEVHFMGDSIYEHGGSWVEVAVGTLQPTKISANTNVSNPGVAESYTLSGNLTDANGKPLSGKEIDLYQFVTGLPRQQEDISQKRYTDQNGSYLFVLNDSTSGNYIYAAWFYGDQTCAYSNTSITLTVGTLTPTTITITTSNSTPAVNQPFTLSGTLKSGTTPLSGKRICLGRTDSSGNYSVVNTTTTNANGAYTFTRSESAQGRYSFLAVFYGDTYAPANAPVSVAVGTLAPTTITITTSNSTPAVNQPFTLSGTLKSGTTPLSGKRICLGRTDSSGNYSVVNTTTTNANGAYTFTRSESAQGRYSFLAVFYGDTYAPANAPVSVAVGTLTPPPSPSPPLTPPPPSTNPSPSPAPSNPAPPPSLANASVSAERIRQAGTTAWSTPPPPTPTVPTPSPAANPRRAATPSWQSSTAIPTPPLTLPARSMSAHDARKS